MHESIQVLTYSYSMNVSVFLHLFLVMLCFIMQSIVNKNL